MRKLIGILSICFISFISYAADTKSLTKIKIQDATKETFSPYGQLIDIPPKEKATVDIEKVTFWKQQAMLKIDGEIEIGVLKVRNMPMVFNELENHFKTATGLICLDGDCIIAVGKPQDKLPPEESLKAFKIKKNQFFVLDDKAWHSATYPVNQEEVTLLVFFKKDALDNDTVFSDMGKTFELVH